MSPTQTMQALEQAVETYLERLELAVKQITGAVPEEALADARDYLRGEAEQLQRAVSFNLV